MSYDIERKLIYENVMPAIEGAYPASTTRVYLDEFGGLVVCCDGPDGGVIYLDKEAVGIVIREAPTPAATPAVVERVARDELVRLASAWVKRAVAVHNGSRPIDASKFRTAFLRALDKAVIAESPAGFVSGWPQLHGKNLTPQEIRNWALEDAAKICDCPGADREMRSYGKYFAVAIRAMISASAAGGTREKS